MFFGSNPNIEDPAVFTEGLAVTKFSNKTSTNENGKSINGTFVSTDFPLFRLAEQYLIYAEAVLRGGTGGSNTQALAYLNLLRERAYGNASGNLSNISLDIVLEERSRELYWEAFRRTDLIRMDVTRVEVICGRLRAGKLMVPRLNLTARFSRFRQRI